MTKNMFFLILPLVCALGCAKEYEPPPGSIPDIPPGRGAAKAQGEGEATASAPAAGKKSNGPGNALAPPK
jgi:hypothetical protein